jgi:hypothetical protein
MQHPLSSAAGMAAGYSLVDEFEDEQPGQFQAGGQAVAAHAMRPTMQGPTAPLGHYQQVLAGAPRLQQLHPAEAEAATAAGVGQKRPPAGAASAERQVPLERPAGVSHTQQPAAVGQPQAHAGLPPSRVFAAAGDEEVAADVELDGIFDFMM